MRREEIIEEKVNTEGEGETASRNSYRSGIEQQHKSIKVNTLWRRKLMQQFQSVRVQNEHIPFTLKCGMDTKERTCDLDAEDDWYSISRSIRNL